MKNKSVLFLLCLLPLLTGCISGASIVRALAKDPATVHIRVTYMGGTLEIDRSFPTNHVVKIP